MEIGAITAPQVWAASARSLTNIGSSALASTSILQTTIAANSGVDLRPSVGTVGMITTGVITGVAATGAITIQCYDGTNGRALVATAAAAQSPAGFTLVNTGSVGLRIFNGDATVAGNYDTAAWVFTI